MTDELVPQSVETPESTGTTEGQGAEKPETQPEAIDPRYAGKSPAELAKMLDEKDSFIGRQGNELGQVRQLSEQVNYLRGLLESRKFSPEAPTAQPKPQFDFTNPEGYIDQRVNEKLGAFQTEIARRDAEQYARSARANFDRGRQEAMKQERELFSGIEAEVTQALAQQVRQGSMAPELLGDPATWTLAASVIRLMRGERDKVATPVRQGMAPTDLGTPGRARTIVSDDDITLTEEDRQFMRQNGLDEKAAVEGIRKGRQMAARGEYR